MLATGTIDPILEFRNIGSNQGSDLPPPLRKDCALLRLAYPSQTFHPANSLLDLTPVLREDLHQQPIDFALARGPIIDAGRKPPPLSKGATEAAHSDLGAVADAVAIEDVAASEPGVGEGVGEGSG